MPALTDQIALVTGASRGIGKGIALGLGEAGAIVYITGRTVQEGEATSHLPGTVHATAEAVTIAGGRGIAIQCDHRSDEQVQAVFNRMDTQEGRLDILVNNVWGGYEKFTDGSPFYGNLPFWQQPISEWDNNHLAPRAHYIASRFAAQRMATHHSGLIVNISSPMGGRSTRDVAYGVAHAAIDRLALNLAEALRDENITVVSLYPGLVRTESVLANAQYFDLSNSESPQFIGRAIAALAADPNRMQKTGQVLVAARLALEYGFSDVDGKQPRPLDA